LGFHIKSRTANIWDDGKVPWSTVTLGTIGHALANLFSSSAAQAEAKNRYIYISAFTTTQLEVLDALEKVTGEKWSQKTVSTKETVSKSYKKFSEERDVPALFDLIRGVAFGEEELSNYKEKPKAWNKLLQLEDENVLDSVIAVVKKVEAA
jgi:hypothetical protein